jgi:hypothetical protein
VANKNKSFRYILPLVKGWSAQADSPIQCYAKNEYQNSLIAEYFKGGTTHEGSLVLEKDDSVLILHEIDEEYLPDYKLIMDGDYSRIRDHTKNIIISRIKKSSDSLFTEKVLYKTKRLRIKLEEELGIDDLDELVTEYDSKMFNEEQIKF